MITLGSRVFPVLILVHYVHCSWQTYNAPYKQRTNFPSAATSVSGTKVSPLLARLYAAKRTALQTASSIDSMIAEAMERERFQHSYPSYKLPVTATFPYIEPDIVGGPKSVGAAIGVHGGRWYSDALGGSAGQIGAAMVNTGTRRNMGYYTPAPQAEVIAGHVTEYEPPYQPVEGFAPVVPNYMITLPKITKPLLNPKQVPSVPYAQKPKNIKAPKIATPLANPPKAGLIAPARKPNITPLKFTKPLANPLKKPSLTGAKKPVRPVWLSKAMPTAAQPTKDPAEDMPKLGDPQDFDDRCTVLKLTFEHFKKGQVIDDSLQKNNVRLSDGVTVTDHSITTSGHSARLGKKGKIVFAKDFTGRPKKAIGISMWVKLDDIQGNHSLLRALDGADNATRYDLAVHGGKGFWVHYDDSGKELFRVESVSSDIRAGKWHNIVANYNSVQKKATLWVDGRLVSQQNKIRGGQLSQKWNKVVVFGGKTAGLLDNVFMFRCPLDRTKIVALYVAAATPASADKKSRIQPKQSDTTKKTHG